MRFVLAALLAAGFALTGYSFVTADQAFADGSGSGSAAMTPDDVLDPLEQPVVAVSQVERLWKSGAFTSAGIVVVFFVLTALRARVPWFGVGYRAVLVSAALAGLSFLVQAIGAGTSPTLSMIVVALCTSLAQLQRPIPPPPAPTPGKTSMLTLVALLAVLVGCSNIKGAASAAAGAIVDCTKGELAPAVRDLAPIAEKLVLDALGPSGDVDWRPVREYAIGLATNVGKCVLAEGVARVLAPKPDDPLAPKTGGVAIDHAAVRRGFANLKSELFGPGVTFETSAGQL
jgi:hypothetical protein